MNVREKHLDSWDGNIFKAGAVVPISHCSAMGVLSIWKNERGSRSPETLSDGISAELSIILGSLGLHFPVGKAGIITFVRLVRSRSHHLWHRGEFPYRRVQIGGERV